MTTAIKINQNDGYIQHEATGGETAFSYDFPIFDAGHLSVYETDVNGTTTLLVKDTDYTVVGVNTQPGSGTLEIQLDSTLYPSGATATHKFTIFQDAPEERTTDFNQAGDFFADTLNKELDLITQQIQQLRRDVDRAPQFAQEVNETGVTMPAPVTNNILTWDANGNLVNAESVIASSVTPTNSTKSREIADLFDILNPQRSLALNDRGAERYVPRPYSAIGSNTTTLIAETTDNLHRHFGQPIRLANGKLLYVYRRAATHAVEGEGDIVAMISSGEGALNTSEFVIANTAGYDLRGVHGVTTPTGRVIIIYSKVDPNDNTDVEFVAQYSDDFGIDGSWSDPYVVFDAPVFGSGFARGFGRLKIKPADNTLGFEIYYAPYYKSSATPTYAIPFRVSTDNGVTFSTRGFIDNDASGDNETDVVFRDALNGLAVSRASGLEVKKTTDGGTNWSSVGTVSNTTSDSVAPTIDIVPHPLTGIDTAVITYCQRSNDSITIKWKKLDDLFSDTTFNTANGYFEGTQIIENSISWENASGYNGTIWYDNRILGVLAFKEFVGETITGITQANPAVVTISGTHEFANGDKIYIEDVVGMTEVNDTEFTVANVTSNTFELQGIDSSAYTAYSSGGTAKKRGSDVVWIRYDWAELVMPFSFDETNNVLEVPGKMQVIGNFYNDAEIEVYEPDDTAKVGVRVEGDNLPIMGQKRENSSTWTDAEWRSWIDSVGNWVFQDTENSREVMRAKFSDGSIAFPNGLRPSGDTGDVLEDFDEGTFTPTLSTTGTDFTSVTYSVQAGRYRRVGNRYEGDFRLIWTATSGSPTGIPIIGGFPFTTKNAVESRACCNFLNGLTIGIDLSGITNASVLGGYFLGNNTHLRLYAVRSDGVADALDASTDIGSTGTLYGTFSVEIN